MRFADEIGLQTIRIKPAGPGYAVFEAEKRKKTKKSS